MFIELICDQSDNRFSFHTGAERETFEFRGLYQDKPQHVQKRVIVALDPGDYKEFPSDQFQMREVLQEMRKAYVGFLVNPWENERTPEILATGHWGTGPSFNGDKELKALIQLIVASAVSLSRDF